MLNTNCTIISTNKDIYIISAYAPTSDKKKDEIEQFYSDLDNLTKTINNIYNFSKN